LSSWIKQASTAQTPLCPETLPQAPAEIQGKGKSKGRSKERFQGAFWDGLCILGWYTASP